MQWHEISIYTTQEASEAISHFLHETGAGGVSIEESSQLHQNRQTELGGWYEIPDNGIPAGEVRVYAYFYTAVDSDEIENIKTQIEQFLNQLNGFGLDKGAAEISSRAVVEDDWAHAWKKYYKPLEISDKLAIKPTWETYEAKPDQKVIELDPGMAFGTGTHATTVLCLKLLEQHIQSGDQVIDVGTGSGILSIAAAHLGAEKVLAIDLDPVAVSSATENIKLNGLEDRIDVKESDLLAVLKQGDAMDAVSADAIQLPVQIVVANILADILLSFMDDVVQVLAPSGTYIASGIIQSKAEEVEEAMKTRGLKIVGRLEEEDWVAIAAQKASS